MSRYANSPPGHLSAFNSDCSTARTGRRFLRKLSVSFRPTPRRTSLRSTASSGKRRPVPRAFESEAPSTTSKAPAAWQRVSPTPIRLFRRIQLAGQSGPAEKGQRRRFDGGERAFPCSSPRREQSAGFQSEARDNTEHRPLHVHKAGDQLSRFGADRRSGHCENDVSLQKDERRNVL